MPATGPHRRARAATAALRTAPWWTSVLLGLVCLLLGLLLTTRPLTSLSALGLLIGLAAITAGTADLLAAYRSHAGAVATATALAWIGFGIAVLAWLGRALDLLAPAVALALVVGGALRLVRAARGDLDERLTTAVLGLADIVFGVLAWRWPDVTVLVVAFLFGIRTVFFGLARIGDGLAALDDRTPDPPRRRPAAPRPGTGDRPWRFSRCSWPSPQPAWRSACAPAPPSSTRSTPHRTGCPIIPARFCAPNRSPAPSPTAPRPGASSTPPPATTTSPPWPAPWSWSRRTPRPDLDR
ncbi:DUF308 domain-containing protein [Rhodococcus aetherivorans]